jgi:hypothetical protein
MSPCLRLMTYHEEGVPHPCRVLRYKVRVSFSCWLVVSMASPGYRAAVSAISLDTFNHQQEDVAVSNFPADLKKNKRRLNQPGRAGGLPVDSNQGNLKRI